MKADPAAQRRLLVLADIDRDLAQLRHRRETLPLHQQIADVIAERRAVEERYVAAETEVGDLTKAQARAEADLEPVRARLERDQASVDSGAITDPKALTGMLGEIDSLSARISDLEDAELEVMEQLEAATAVRDELAEARRTLAAQHKEFAADRDTQVGDLDADIAARESDRATATADVPADLLAAYDKTVERQGTGAAALASGRCGGCLLEANPADLSRYQSAPADEVIRCEECGRILVR